MGSPDDPGQSPDLDGGADILRERDRIAAELQNEVIQRIFSIGLNLQGTVAMTNDPVVRRRVDHAIDDLDQLVRIVRDTVFKLEARLKDRGLRAGILDLCKQLSPVPDVAFRGPVDGALHPVASTQLLEILDDALAVIRRRWAPILINVTANDGGHVTVLRAVPLSGAMGAVGAADEFPDLRGRAAQAGMRIEIEPGPDFVQISWHAA